MKINIKAFTLVETMIVVVIFGLIAAMAIPAFQKVRHNYIYRKGERGQRLDADEAKIYREMKKAEDLDNQIQAKIEKSVEAQTLILDGKIYILLPKINYQETEIAGKTYYLVPQD